MGREKVGTIMARYDMRCTVCGWEGEVECKIADCCSQRCSAPIIESADVYNIAISPDGALGVNGLIRGKRACGGALEIVIAKPSSGRVDMRYGAKAILGDGSKIKGAFGRDDRKNKLGF